ncbi:MAG: hypothetical protein ABI581_03435 [Sediminibacterium sp.]
MKILLIILAVLVTDARDEDRSPAVKPSDCRCKMKCCKKVASVPERNFLLIKLQG